MATLSASRRNSANSNSNSTTNTPRPSITALNGDKSTLPRMSSLNEEESIVGNNDVDVEDDDVLVEPEIDDDSQLIETKTDDELLMSKGHKECTERSDSGISDCSTHLTSSSVISSPPLAKKLSITEEVVNDKTINKIEEKIVCLTNNFEKRKLFEFFLVF